MSLAAFTGLSSLVNTRLADRRFWLGSLVTFCLFWVTARLGIDYGSLPPSNLTVVWLPAGIGLVACIALGYRAVIAIWLAAFLINLQDFTNLGGWQWGSELFHSFLAAPINASQAAIAYTLWRRFLGAPIQKSRQLWPLIGWVCLLPTALTLPILVANQAFGGFLPWDDVPNSLLTIWIGDSLGIFLILPLYDGWRQNRRLSIKSLGWLGLSFAALVLILVLTFVLYPVFLGVTLLALLGLALQIGLLGSALGATALSIVALLATRQGLGPFHRLDPDHPDIAVILLMFSISLAVHIVGLQYSEIRRQRDRLQSAIDEQTNHLLNEIEELDQTRRELEDSKIFTENLIQAANAMVVLLDLEGRIQEINPIAEAITGYHRSEILGKNWFESIVPRDRYPNVWEQFKNCGTQDIPHNFENPILTKDGQERYIVWRNSRVFRKNECIGSVSFGIDITDRRASEKAWERQACYDFLTGLANRFLLQEQGQELLLLAQRNQDTLAVIFIDLDRFKEVNDNFGHEMGDRVLTEVAQRIRQSVRQSDLIARLSGDEFIAILPNTDAQGAAILAQKLQQQITQPILLNNRSIQLTTSLGISLYPVDGDDLEVLIKKADAAMYSIKEGGRDAFSFFTATIGQRLQERLEFEADLRAAIARDQFKLFYQPQISLEDNSIIGLESLLRWQHPRLGLLMPKDFLPIAIEIGLMEEIQQWVLKTACTQNALWQAQGLKSVPIGINFSGFPIQGFCPQIHDILAQSELRPQYIELELNEAILAEQELSGNKGLRQLKNLGLKIAVDDFGCSESTLACLRNEGLNRMKIDASLIQALEQDPSMQKIVTAIIDLGLSLGLRVLAEGVETEFQRQWLKQRGCHEIQGFLMSFPLPAEAVPEVLANGL
ncbi:bifunctional diguanylate cyclase/phosphodiesterase [Synechococcus elongatus]|uniref:EAL domain-containing protein n=1 Tax=Synechococcus elongatus PCC 11802 TaxID=2283154 RepID=A0AAT9K0D3_SYNEL|nr:EAL domain-containing protein [Synechococcus elongatus]QFZ93013.1 EAL domain-containing protein [Synechococcus elongatus PCC 11802]